MTLTQLIPTLRASIPDPLDHRLWPSGTTATLVDVLVDGLSLLHVAQLSGTPSYFPTVAGPDGRVSVCTVRIVAVTAHSDGEPLIFVDGDAEYSGAVWAEARLIGRVSTARAREVVIRPAPPYGTSTTRSQAILPIDLHEGDLIAVPCVAPRPIGTSKLVLTSDDPRVGGLSA